MKFQLLLAFADFSSNRAPTGVFVILGITMAVAFVVLLFTIPISGADFTYRSTKYYGGPFGGGSFGGFGQF